MISRQAMIGVLAFLAGITPAWADTDPNSRIFEITMPIDTAGIPPLLTAVPGIDPGQVWFAFGTQTFFRGHDDCVSARKIWVWSKPALSSPGLYRGHLYQLETPATDPNNPACNPTSLDVHADTPIATFLNPADVDVSDSNMVGLRIPGVFEVKGTVPDDRLLAIGSAIPVISKCLRAELRCPYKLDNSNPMRRVTPVLTTGTLTEVDVASDGTGTHYQAVFGSDSSLTSEIRLDLYFDGTRLDRAAVSVGGGGPPI